MKFLPCGKWQNISFTHICYGLLTELLLLQRVDTDNQVSKQRQKAIEMSSKEYGSAGLDPEFEEVEGDVIIDAQEVEEVVEDDGEDDGEEPMDEDYGDDNDEELDAADMAAMAEEFEGN